MGMSLSQIVKRCNELMSVSEDDECVYRLACCIAELADIVGSRTDPRPDCVSHEFHEPTIQGRLIQFAALLDASPVAENHDHEEHYYRMRRCRVAIRQCIRAIDALQGADELTPEQLRRLEGDDE